MSRFFLSAEAARDLDEILEYLDRLPDAPAERIGQSLQSMLESIAMRPLLGAPHSHLTRLLGEEVRSRLVPPYRIFFIGLARVLRRSLPFFTARGTSGPLWTADFSSRRP